jgi:hypothetical protein
LAADNCKQHAWSVKCILSHCADSSDSEEETTNTGRELGFDGLENDDDL